jgi:hypothetical protein
MDPYNFYLFITKNNFAFLHFDINTIESNHETLDRLARITNNQLWQPNNKSNK